MGLRLRWLCDGTDRLNWRDLEVIIVESGRESAVMRYELGEAFGWEVGEYLLAGVLDALNGANYQRGGGKGQQPKPVPRPNVGQQIEHHPENTGGQMFAGDDFEMDSVTIEEMDAWLGLKPAA